jgi:hypothetical protein
MVSTVSDVARLYEYLSMFFIVFMSMHFYHLTFRVARGRVTTTIAGSSVLAKRHLQSHSWVQLSNPCNGGAFFWVAEHDSSGSWSSTVGDAIFRNAGGSDATLC